MFIKMTQNTIRTMATPDTPADGFLISEGNADGVYIPNVALHISGVFANPAHKALYTAKLSSYPLYVLLLMTIAGYIPLPYLFQYFISSSIIEFVNVLEFQFVSENEAFTQLEVFSKFKDNA